jgi:hypothetical protein
MVGCSRADPSTVRGALAAMMLFVRIINDCREIYYTVDYSLSKVVLSPEEISVAVELRLLVLCIYLECPWLLEYEGKFGL